MSDEPSTSVPPELRVALDVELTIEELKSALKQQELETALANVSGIESMSFWENKLAIRYDPEKLTKGKLSALIVAAGFSIADARSAPPTPPVE